MSKVLLFFVDGVGIGDDAPHNPWVHATLPNFRSILGGGIPLLITVPSTEDRAASIMQLDATLGIDGTPQSGTGQATLFTGNNAAALNGRHFGPWVPSALRPMLRRESVLAAGVNAGRKVTFANAYPRALIDAALAEPSGRKLPAFINAGPPVAAAGAHVFTRDVEHLRRGDAVSSEITNDGWRVHLGYNDLPVVTPAEAGRTLGGIANQYDLTLFAHYATDTIGHAREMADAMRALERVDGFLGGILESISDDVMLVVASDHGNIEDMRVGHTRNPALGLLYGNGHAALASGATSLMHVAPLIRRMLDVA